MSNYDVTSPVEEILQKRRRIILILLLVALALAVCCFAYCRWSERSTIDAGGDYSQTTLEKANADSPEFLAIRKG